MMLEFNILENQAKQVEQQLILIEQQLAEFQILQQSLEDTKKVKNQKVLSPISKGIFFESEVKEIKEVFLDIGSGLTRISLRRYMLAVVFGSPLRIFWVQYIIAGVGKSLFNNPYVLVEYFLGNKILFIFSIAYLGLVILVAFKIKQKG